jgi:hypothetical protein
MLCYCLIPMDSRSMGRQRRLPPWQTVWRQLLFLVIFWYPLDGAGEELPWAWRISNSSAYVSMMEISEDIVIFDDFEEKTEVRGARNDLINFCWIYYKWHPFSFFVRPICRDRRGTNILCAFTQNLLGGAAKYDVISGVTKAAIISEERGSFTDARAPRYGWSASIIFETVARNGGSILLNLGRESGSRCAAIFTVSSQPETGINGTDIGAELPLFSIGRDISLVTSGISEATAGGDSSLSILPGLPHLVQLAAYGTEREGGEDRGKYARNRKDGGPIPNGVLVLVAVASTIFSFVFMRRALAVSGLWSVYFWFSGIACAAGAACLIVTVMSPYTG